MKTRVIGIGDNVCDKYYPAKIMYPGGQAMNFSVYAKMLGADAAYMGVFGRDEVADHVIRTLDELGVDHSRCRQYDGENGYAKVRLVDGDREFIMSNKGGIVNEQDMYEALKAGKIGGYASDVMENELAGSGLTGDDTFASPLFECDNFIVSPHIGAQSVDASKDIGVHIVAKVKEALGL